VRGRLSPTSTGQFRTSVGRRHQDPGERAPSASFARTYYGGRDLALSPLIPASPSWIPLELARFGKIHHCSPDSAAPETAFGHTATKECQARIFRSPIAGRPGERYRREGVARFRWRKALMRDAGEKISVRQYRRCMGERPLSIGAESATAHGRRRFHRATAALRMICSGQRAHPSPRQAAMGAQLLLRRSGEIEKKPSGSESRW
jgi:hypothetical protein